MKRFLLLIPLLMSAALQAAEYHTPNFTVTCENADLAKQVGDTAEFYRKQHARDWLGVELPKWYAPCPVRVRSGQMGAGGTTTFSFNRGQVFGWDMVIQGPPERLIDSVVPHEVLHAIFACHFKRSLPRWADEGAATYTEAEGERKNYRDAGLRVVGKPEHIPLNDILAATEYPADANKVFQFYGQSFVLAEYLLDLKGKPEYIKFLETYFNSGSWETAFRKHYALSPGDAYIKAVQAHRPATPVDYNSYHIDVFVQDKCPPCEKWKNKELAKLVAAKNLKVRIYDLGKDYTWERAKQDGINSTPSFVVYRNEKRQAVLQGYRTTQELLAECKEPETVKVAQGIGIGYFGPVGGNRNENRSNPHQDFSAAQLQQLNALIDQRSQMAIDGTITNRMSDLEKLMDSRIKNAILEIRSKLTDEQKALIGATDAQKAILDGLRAQVDQVEAGKTEFIKQHQAALEEQEKQTAALAEEVKAAKDAAADAVGENATLKEKLAALAKEGVKTAATGFMGTMMGGATPPSLALTLIGGIATFLWNRRKKDELAKQADATAAAGK